MRETRNLDNLQGVSGLTLTTPSICIRTMTDGEEKSNEDDIAPTYRTCLSNTH